MPERGLEELVGLLNTERGQSQGYLWATLASKTAASSAPCLAIVLLFGLIFSSFSGRIRSLEIVDHTTFPNYSLKESLDLCMQNESLKCAMYHMSHTGLGSQLMNMFASRMYLQQVHGFDIFLVDDALYGYKQPDDGTSVMTGYFSPHWPCLSHEKEYEQVEHYFPPGFNITKFNQGDNSAQASHFYRDMVMTEPLPGAVVMTSVKTFRESVPWLSNQPAGGYFRFVDSMCDELQFNEKVQPKINRMRAALYDGLPRFLHSWPYKSVAFHVRRTDKLRKESAFFPAEMYVKKLSEVIQEDAIQKADVKLCFLASDDFKVHAEMRQALRSNNFTCHYVYTPPLGDDEEGVSSGQKGLRYKAAAGLIFITELSVLMEASYFIGTFNSNVGALVSVLRACPGRYNGTHHYARSYGVDREDWYFR